MGNEFAGGGEHDRVQLFRAVVLPGGEDVFGDGGEVADVDPLVVEIEPDRLNPAVAHGERCGGFRGANPSIPAAKYWAVEVKRVAGLDAVEQLTRYVELLNRDTLLAPVGGILAAQTIKPLARTLAEDRGLRCVAFDYDALRGMDPTTPRLF